MEPSESRRARKARIAAARKSAQTLRLIRKSPRKPLSEFNQRLADLFVLGGHK